LFKMSGKIREVIVFVYFSDKDFKTTS